MLASSARWPMLLARDSRMASRRDEVEASVNTVVLELGVTLNHRLLGKHIVKLVLDVGEDHGKAGETRQETTNASEKSASKHRPRDP